MSNRFEKHVPVMQLDEITSTEENILAELAAISFQTGDLIYYNGADLVRLAIGTSGQMLQVSGGIPAWVSSGTPGDVVGPASSSDNAIALFDGATGKLLKQSSVTISGAAITGLTTFVSSIVSMAFASGAILDFNGGDVLITHSANLLTISGGGLTVTGTTTLATTLTGVLRADSGIVSVDSDVTDLVTAADLTTAGKVEIATAAETSTGTDATRAVSPDGLSQSVFGGKYAQFMLFESDTSVTTGNGVGGFAVPADYNGMNLVDATATVHTKGITGATDVQIRRRRAGTDADMLGTKITVGDEFFVSDGVVDGANDDLLTGDQIYCDVDAVHSGTAPLGLTVVLTFRLA